MKIYDGISQMKRKNHMLNDDYFQIMELSFHDLLGFIRDYSQNLKYFNLNNEQDGKWEQLLIPDEIVVISDIINLKIEKIENDFTRVLNSIDFSKKAYCFKQIMPILILVEQIDSWCEILKNKNVDTPNQLFNEIEGLINTHLARKYQLYQLLIPEKEFEGKRLNDIWTREDTITASSIEISKQKSYFKQIFYTLKSAVEYLKQKSESYLQKSLKNQQHAPHIALLATFLNLSLETNKKLNTFSNKYVDFYYNDVLKVISKSYSPDSTYLYFQLKDGIPNVLIKKDTLFKAGQDESKKKIFYSSDYDLVINTARVAKLYTLYLEQNDLIWPQINCTNILKDEIPVGNDREDNLIRNSKPLFGSSTSLSSESAELGFAISDECLLLSEGRRKVDIEFCFSEKTYQLFAKQLENLFDDCKVSDGFVRLFTNLFKVYVSTENGWFSINNYLVDGYLVNSKQNKNTLNIQFKLSSNDPAISACFKQVHGASFIEGVPVIKLIINSSSYFHPYSILNELEIVQINILTEVEELKNILINNELGQVDTAKPFYPFGVLPKLNSYFIMGGYEISKKDITNLSLKINWNNLSTEKEGLLEYFNAYETDIKKSSYKCAISFLNNGKWLPIENSVQKEVFLFSSENEIKGNYKEKLAKETVFENIDCTIYKQDANRYDVSNYRYDNYALGGFVKFTLTNPPFVFGHTAYSETISKISIENARKKTNKALPNPPFSPLIDSVHLNYTSKSKIDFKISQRNENATKKQFYHLHPWGYESILGKAKFDHINLMPAIKDKGNLIIGLEHAKPNWTITLLFNLLDDSKLEVEMNPPVLKWHYLSSNQWKPFENTGIVSDTTNGFLNTGIITITIPSDINKENTLLSDQYHWIKIAANKNIEAICSLVNITAQVLRVSWLNQNNLLSHLDQALAAKSILKANETLSGIKSITQPLDSFNGLAPENKGKERLRVSERLKHKNRAVTPWDYERIILENFPQIYKVKCIPHSSSKSPKSPGNLLIIAIGNTDNAASSIHYDPMIGNKILHEIKELVASLNSGFAKIEVRNPVYERIQVRCSVKLKEGLDSGYFIDLLNKKIIDFLTPSHSESLNDVGFGKVVKCTDVLSFIQNFEFVEFATDFSILQITCDSQHKFHLLDTAVGKIPQVEGEVGDVKLNEHFFMQNIVKPTYPWVILVALEQQAIELRYDKDEVVAKRTGINELLIDSTFIIEA